MKKKILLSFLAIISLFTITGCGKNSKLEEIAKKINNCETVKNYKEYGYEIKATTKKNTLTVTSKLDKKTTKVDFKLDGDILSNEKLSIDDLLAALLVINGVGETYGYKDGELSKNVNTFTEEIKQYTLAKEGLELLMNGDKTSLKIDLSKKVPLIDMNNFYLKADDLDIIAQIKNDNQPGNQNGKRGNIAYDVFIGEEESTIQIGQDEKLSDSAYKSIITALEVLYGEDTAKHFQELYPKFIDGTKTVEEFTVEKNYKPENQDDSVFKNTEVVLVTIKKKVNE